MHTWYTYPVSIARGGRWMDHGGADVDSSGDCWRSSSRGRCTATSCGRSSSSGTGATWPLNIGQVYTTVTRLERDGARRARHGRRRTPERPTSSTAITGRRVGERGARRGSPRRSSAAQPPATSSPSSWRSRVTLPGVDVPRGDPAPSARATMGVAAGLHPPQATGGRRRGRRRPGLAPRPRRPDLRRRGRGALARPRRGAAAPARSRGRATSDAPAARRPAASDDQARPADDRAVLAAARRHPRARPGAAEVHALRGVNLRVAARRAGRGDGPVRVGQVDAAAPRRRPRRARRPARSCVEGSDARPALATRGRARLRRRRSATSSRTSTSSRR